MATMLLPMTAPLHAPSAAHAVVPTAVAPTAVASTAVATGNHALDALMSMFPGVEREVLADVLAQLDSNLDQVIDYLLGAADDAPNDDLARRVQAEEDAEVAKAVHASLQAELKAEAEAAKEARPSQVASRVMSSASLRAKRFLQQRARTSLPSETSTHEARLLDAPLESSNAATSYDMTPLQVPAYVPPTTPVSTPAPEPEAQSSTRTPNDAAPVADPALYNARLDRARSANRVRTQSRLSFVPPPASAGSGPLAPVVVPEGQLI